MTKNHHINQNPRHAGIIFFDFDGVIADSFAAAFAVNRLIRPSITEEAYRRRFDGNINESSTEAPGEAYHPEIDFFAEYGPRLSRCKLFPGMEEVLRKAAGANRLVINSSSRTDIIVDFLKTQKIESYFTEVLGNDAHASKVVKLQKAFADYHVTPGECIFITDTLGDIKEAREAGVSAIAVSWGYQKEEPLQRGNPAQMVDTPKALLAALSAFAAGPGARPLETESQ